MFLAPEFVFVHLSKTGGTFAEQTLREILCPSPVVRKLHRLKTRYGIKIPFLRYRYNEVGDQHAICNEIPAAARDMPIVSCIRNPFNLYVSEYTFNWWKKYPTLWFHDFRTVERAYPDWQKLDFESFIDVSNGHSEWVHKALVRYPESRGLGWYTHKFIHYYCRDQDRVFEMAGDFDRMIARVRDLMHPVHFLHTEHLNDELFEYLTSRGYPAKSIDFIRRREKINASRSDHNYRTFYTPELRHKIEQKDALIFKLFPEFHY